MMTSMVVTIDDILDQLMAENKRLLKELLFATKCLNILNELKIELNLIYKKFETQLNTEDKFNQLRHQLNLISRQTYDKTFAENNCKLLRCDTIDVINNGIQCMDSEYEEDIHVVDNSKSQDIIDENDGQNYRSLSSSDLIEIKTKRIVVQKIKCRYDGCNKTFAGISGRCYHEKSYHKKLYCKKKEKKNTKTTTQTLSCRYDNCDKQFKTTAIRDYHEKAKQRSHETLSPIRVSDLKSIIKTKLTTKRIIEQNLKCRYDGCNKTFAGKNGRCYHEKSYHKKLYCKKKDAKTTTETLSSSDLVEDITKKINKLKCRYDGCYKMFAGGSGRYYHEKSYHKKKDSNITQTSRCRYDNCDKQFKTTAFRDFHEKAKHGSNQTLSSFCVSDLKSIIKSKLTANNSIMTTTTEDHSDDGEFLCRIDGCIKSFKTYKSIVRHKQVDHKNHKPLKCDYDNCGKTFKQLKSLHNHQLVHRPAIFNSQPFQCTYIDCNKTFTTTSSYTRHIRRRHLLLRKFKCFYDGCLQLFDTENSYQLHRLSHKDELFSCDIDGCKSKFMSKSSMKTHLATIHTSEPTIKCTVQGCTEMFYNYRQIRKHRQSDHDILPETFRCQWPGCDYVVNVKVRMQEHRSSHLGVRPFECHWPQCERKFIRKEELKQHMNIHTNVKPYACSWPGCDYRAAHHSGVAHHMKNKHKKPLTQ